MRQIFGRFFPALSCVVVCLAAGCNKADKSVSNAAAQKTIGVTLLTREHEFYRQLEEGLKTAATQHNYKLIVTSGDFDLAKQQSQIDNFIVQHVDAIVL